MVLGIIRSKLKKFVDVILDKDKRNSPKAKFFLSGMLVGEFITFAIIAVIIANNFGFTVIFGVPKQITQTSQNLDNLDIYGLAYFKGVLDTLYFQYTNTFICRYNNLNEAMFFIDKHNAYYNSTIYLLADPQHVRSAVWYNNTLYVFDVTDPTYHFKPSDSEIFECTMSTEQYYYENCTIIYYDGLYHLIEPQDKYVISSLLGINIS